MKKLNINSYAKINLHLEVGPLMADGFHQINSIFHAVDLHDEISLSLNNNGQITIEPDMGFPVEKNLMFKAAKAFFEEAGIDKGLDVFINKNIPMGAGLGGGSSNAAAVLKGLNFMHDEIIGQERLQQLGAQIGSDVPFFLESTASVVTGRGERLRAVDPVSYEGILVVPDVHVSTPVAYGLIDSSGLNKISFQESPELELSKKPSQWQYENTFFKPVCSKESGIKDVYDQLAGGSAGFTAMSGSGSGVFKIFDNKNDINNEIFLLKKHLSCVYRIKLLVKFKKPFYNYLN